MTPTLRLPAEWEQQSGVLVSWPTASTDWQDNLADAEKTYLELAQLIASNCHAYICCSDSATLQRVDKLCHEKGIPAQRYSLFTVAYNDTWTRDYGPISVHKENELVWLDFEFNAWGGKYEYNADNQFTRLLHRQFKRKRILQHNDFILEGGSIDGDGEGTILTTSRCLLDPARNPGLIKKQIEDRLKSSLGIQRILWIDHGYLQGDDTDAHIDTLVRFCSADTITYVQCTDSTDPHFSSLSAMEVQLKSYRQTDGREYRFIPLPLPSACFNQRGQRLPASYANFLILNGNILAPVYGVDTDSLALTQLQECFPQHRVIPVQCKPLIEQFGSLHCVTMQIL